MKLLIKIQGPFLSVYWDDMPVMVDYFSDNPLRDAALVLQYMAQYGAERVPEDLLKRG